MSDGGIESVNGSMTGGSPFGNDSRASFADDAAASGSFVMAVDAQSVVEADQVTTSGETNTTDAALPSVAKCIVDSIYTPLLDEDVDDASQRFRKGVIAATLVGVPFALVVLIGNLLSDAGSRRWSAAKALAVLGPCPVIIALPILYAMVRSKRYVSEALVHVLLAVAVLFYLCMTISTPDVDWTVSWLQCALIVLLSRTAFVGPWLVVTAVGMLLAVWNARTYAAGESDLSAFVADDLEVRKLQSQLIVAVPFVLFGFLFLFILQGQLVLSEHLADQAAMSSSVARHLTAALTRYDIDNAAALIRRQRAQVSGDAIAMAVAEDAAPDDKSLRAHNTFDYCDPRLLDSFDTLVQNLSAYRPHIPNWLLPSGNTEGGTSSQSEFLDSGSTRGPQSLPGSVRTKYHARGGGYSSEPDLMLPSSGSLMSSGDADHRHDSHHSGHYHSGHAHKRRSSLSTPIQKAWMSPRATGISPTPQAQRLNPVPVVGPALIVLARVAFDVRPDARDSATHVLDRFVDRVFVLANSLGAAAHSFVGDTVTLSWNAANRVSQPEIKAARFLARLKEDTGHPDALVGGAAFLGTALVGMNGVGAGQRAVTVRARWWHTLHRMFEFGRANEVLIVNNDLRTQAEIAVCTRGIGGFTAIDWRKTFVTAVGARVRQTGTSGSDASPSGATLETAPMQLETVPTLLRMAATPITPEPRQLTPSRTPQSLSGSSLPSTSPVYKQTRLGLFEVMREFATEAEQDKDEWMYVLQRHSTAAPGKMPTAPDQLTAKDIAVKMVDAVALWEEHSDVEAVEKILEIEELLAANASLHNVYEGIPKTGLAAMMNMGDSITGFVGPI